MGNKIKYSPLGSIDIIYNDIAPATYKGVEAYYSQNGKKKETKIFYNKDKDPTYDYWAASMWLKCIIEAHPIMESSSIHHFAIHDGGKINFEPSDEYLRNIAKNLKKEFKIK